MFLLFFFFFTFSFELFEIPRNLRSEYDYDRRIIPAKTIVMDLTEACMVRKGNEIGTAMVEREIGIWKFFNEQLSILVVEFLLLQLSDMYLIKKEHYCYYILRSSSVPCKRQFI